MIFSCVSCTLVNFNGCFSLLIGGVGEPNVSDGRAGEQDMLRGL